MKVLGYFVYSGVIAGLLAAMVAFAPAESRTLKVEAGPIWSQSDAQQKCPKIAAANDGVWTGQWQTTVPGRMSVCDVRLRSKERSVVESIEAGPIWSQSDAEKKCPQVATRNGGVWTGQWKTTVPGRMSVCELRFPRK